MTTIMMESGRIYRVEKGFFGLGTERIKCWNCEKMIDLKIQKKGIAGINVGNFVDEKCPYCGSIL